MNANHLAILLYGALTLIFTFLLSLHAGSGVAMVLVIMATAATYVFQTAQEYTDNVAVLCTLWALVIALVLGSIGYSLGAL